MYNSGRVYCVKNKYQHKLHDDKTIFIFQQIKYIRIIIIVILVQNARNSFIESKFIFEIWFQVIKSDVKVH